MTCMAPALLGHLYISLKGEFMTNFSQPSQDVPNQNSMMNYPKPKSIAAIIALVLGILALITSFLPIINNGSFILAVIGIILAIIGLIGTVRGKKSGKRIAIAALIISVVSCAVVLGTQSMYSAAIDEATDTTIDVATTDQGATDAQGASSEYEISGESLDDTNEYFAVITGTFTNNSEEELTAISITYNLYDAEGTQIGNAYASANNVAPGSSWAFEATSSVEPGEVASFERGDVSAW